MDLPFRIKKVGRVLLFLFILLMMNQIFAEKISKDIQYTEEIIRILVQEMSQKYGLNYIGYGGNLNGGVRKLSVEFVAYRKINIDEAREIEINANDRFLNLINSHSKIRPYLKEYPFTVNSAHVSLAFYKSGGGYHLDGSVASVCYGKNKIFYRKAELVKSKSIPFRSTDGSRLPSYMTEVREIESEELMPLHEESYEEALKIVRENPSCVNAAK